MCCSRPRACPWKYFSCSSVSFFFSDCYISASSLIVNCLTHVVLLLHIFISPYLFGHQMIAHKYLLCPFKSSVVSQILTLQTMFNCLQSLMLILNSFKNSGQHKTCLFSAAAIKSPPGSLWMYRWCYSKNNNKKVQYKFLLPFLLGFTELLKDNKGNKIICFTVILLCVYVYYYVCSFLMNIWGLIMCQTLKIQWWVK